MNLSASRFFLVQLSEFPTVPGQTSTASRHPSEQGLQRQAVPSVSRNPPVYMPFDSHIRLCEEAIRFLYANILKWYYLT